MMWVLIKSTSLKFSWRNKKKYLPDTTLIWSYIIEKSSFYSGYYVEPSRPHTIKMTQEEMAAVMTSEILEGCEGTAVRAGIIGEIGCSWPILGNNIKYAKQRRGLFVAFYLLQFVDKVGTHRAIFLISPQKT